MVEISAIWFSSLPIAPSGPPTSLATIISHCFALQLIARMREDIFGLGGETDDEARPAGSALRDGGENVRIFGQREVRRSGRTFLIFCTAAVATRQSATAAVAMKISAGKAASTAASISRARSRHAPSRRRADRADATGPLTSVTSAPAAAAAAAMAWPCLPDERLAMIAHRIDRLMRRAGGDDDMPAGERPLRSAGCAMPGGSGNRRLAVERRLDRGENCRRLAHPARAIFAAGHLAIFRADEENAVAAAAWRHCAASPAGATCAGSSPARREFSCRSRAAASRRDRRRGHAPSWREDRPSPARRRRDRPRATVRYGPISALVRQREEIVEDLAAGEARDRERRDEMLAPPRS